MKKNMAIILCSGGIDSVVTGYYVKNILKYKKINIIFFDYGQKSLKQERRCARKCAKAIGAEFIEIKLPWLGKISNSLINQNGKIKELNKKELKNTKKESKKFYVPFRNGVFLSNTLAYAESLFIKEGKKERIKSDIFIGFKCEGKDNYPDTTKKFINEINRLSRIATFGFKVYAPLIDKDKEDIILLGKKLGVDFKDTFSCYVPKSKKSCGYCLSCMLRKNGFYWAGIEDITDYEKRHGR